MNFQAVIFDFDGLIIDSEISDFQSWQDTFVQYGGIFPRAEWDQIIGTNLTFDPLDILEKQLGRSVNREVFHMQRQQRDKELLAEQSILPGVTNYLAKAREMGLRIGLASSSDHAWVDAHLERLQLTDWFETVKCSDDVNGRAKPNPDVYLAAVAALDVTPQNALALEDSPNGALAARRAGLACVVIPNAMTAKLDFSAAEPSYKLYSLADLTLPELLQVLKQGDRPL